MCRFMLYSAIGCLYVANALVNSIMYTEVLFPLLCLCNTENGSGLIFLDAFLVQEYENSSLDLS